MIKGKYLLISTFTIIVAVLINKNLQPKDEFKIYNSYKISMDNYESVTLHVIANVKNRDINELFDTICTFYCQYETPSKLTINLYDSVYSLEISSCHVTRTYENE